MKETYPFREGHEKEGDLLEEGIPFSAAEEEIRESEKSLESGIDIGGLPDIEYIRERGKKGREHLADLEQVKKFETLAPKKELIKELELKKEIEKKPEISRNLKDAVTIFNYEVQSKIEILAGGREARRFPDEKVEEAREFIENTYNRLIEEKRIRTQADEDVFIRNLEVITPAGKKLLEEFKAARLHNLEGTV